MLKSTIIAALIAVNPNYCENKMADVLKKLIDSGAIEIEKPKPTGPCKISLIDAQMLKYTNAYRSKNRACGGRTYLAVKPLKWSCELAKAAKSHSDDMARNRKMSHTGSDGSSMSTRVRRTKFKGGYLGENIAAGYRSVDSVMKGWMGSAGHCKNIMNGNFKYFGHNMKINYWTQVFGG